MAVLKQATFDCPRDGAVLVPTQFKAGHLHLCHTCSGSFLPGEIVREVRRIERWFAARRGGTSGLSLGAVECPAGHGRMSMLRVDGHHIDICATCHGIWFDSDELKRLQQPAASERLDRVIETTDAVDAGDSIVDGVGELASGALELLGDIISGIDISF